MQLNYIDITFYFIYMHPVHILCARACVVCGCLHVFVLGCVYVWQFLHAICNTIWTHIRYITTIMMIGDCVCPCMHVHARTYLSACNKLTPVREQFPVIERH